MVGLDFSKKKGITLDVNDVLVHLIIDVLTGLRDSPFTLDTIVCFCLICCSHAHTMVQNLPSTPHRNFLDVR